MPGRPRATRPRFPNPRSRLRSIPANRRIARRNRRRCRARPAGSRCPIHPGAACHAKISRSFRREASAGAKVNFPGARMLRAAVGLGRAPADFLRAAAAFARAADDFVRAAPAPRFAPLDAPGNLCRSFARSPAPRRISIPCAFRRASIASASNGSLRLPRASPRLYSPRASSLPTFLPSLFSSPCFSAAWDFRCYLIFFLVGIFAAAAAACGCCLQLIIAGARAFAFSRLSLLIEFLPLTDYLPSVDCLPPQKSLPPAPAAHNAAVVAQFQRIWNT